MVRRRLWLRDCDHVLYHWAYDDRLISCTDCGLTWRRAGEDGLYSPPAEAVPDDVDGESELVERDGAVEPDTGRQGEPMPDR